MQPVKKTVKKIKTVSITTSMRGMFIYRMYQKRMMRQLTQYITIQDPDYYDCLHIYYRTRIQYEEHVQMKS